MKAVPDMSLPDFLGDKEYPMTDAEQARMAELKQKPVSELTYAEREELGKLVKKGMKRGFFKTFLWIFIGVPAILYLVFIILGLLMKR